MLPSVSPLSEASVRIISTGALVIQQASVVSCLGGHPLRPEHRFSTTRRSASALDRRDARLGQSRACVHGWWVKHFDWWVAAGSAI